MDLNNNLNAFYALLRAGLWEQDVLFPPNEPIDFSGIQILAEEQSVVGLISAGLEHVKGRKLAKKDVIQFVGKALQMEQKNDAMNRFIMGLEEKMNIEGINHVLVKGQGIAQCYERPLWRKCGDVDLLLDSENYEIAKSLFASIASSIEKEEYVSKHIGFSVDSWLVELHGHMYFGLSNRVDKVLLEVEKDILHLGGVRVWNNNDVDVYLPNPDNDIILVFTHFLGHFCFGGIGLRQLCDLYRLLWTYNGVINIELLKKRLCEMGLLSEWKVFAAAASNWLGMPSEHIPFYSPSISYKRRALRALNRIIKSGDSNQNSDERYRVTHSRWKGDLLTFRHRLGEFFSLMTIFPLHAPLFFVNYLITKITIAKARKRGISSKRFSF